ncbi:putative reverse transcriptase domain-containing protein [Tanacetum coccineum]|uniref:Reverse transcriptase domain-containing protein n=1 Tax=Tanacetum coccineum TaxID=301880 RepID=A0ABQ5D2X0_9ASTR
MNRVCRPYLDKFVIVFIDDILIYSKTWEEHEMHLGLVLELHVINGNKIHVDPSKIEAVKNWKAPRTPSEGEEQENVFQTLKDKLYNATVLALPDGPEDFVVYCDASGLGLGCVLMQRGKVIAYASRQLKIHEKNYTTHDLELGAVLFGDYDCEIRYHPDKANVLADALSRNERVKPERVRAMNMTLQLSIKDRIPAAQKEASNEFTGLQKGLDEMIELRNEGALDRYWWPGMKKDIAVYVMGTTQSGSDRLTKSAYFLPMLEDYKMERLARLYLNEIIVRHGVPISIISDRDSRFTSRFWQSMQEALDMSTAYHPQTDGQIRFLYNNSYHSSVRCASFEELYGRKCHSPIMWAEVREGQFIGPKLVQETTEKISQIKDRLKAARDCQKSYADKRRKPLEFSVGDYVLLKVSPWKGVVRFGKKGKLAPKSVEILEREFKKLKRSRISIVKVRWNSKCGPEFTWKRKDQMKLKSGLNYKPPQNPLENNLQTKPSVKETSTTDNSKEPDKLEKTTESHVHSILFLGRLKKEKEKEQFRKFHKNLQQLSINIPFIEALEQIPKYAKFMKDLLSKKGRMEETSRITLNERCSVILLNEIPLKEKDPGSFTIPCIIGNVGINKALTDLGASISLMSYSMFTRLGLGELKPTRMCIELANKTTQYPRGITENVIVKIDKFVFLVDFVVLDIKEDHKIPIILGLPFLAIAHAMIDVFNKKISFKVGNETVTFDIEKSMKFSSLEDDTCLSINMVDLTILDHA